MKNAPKVVHGFLCVVVIFLLHCAQQTINSHWADESVNINGTVDDWQSALIFDEELDASYGIQNDDKNLYLTFVTANPSLQRQVMMRGLVFWINKAGDKQKEIGFKFPRGLMERGLPMREVMTIFGNRGSNFTDVQRDHFMKQYFRDIQILDSKNHNLGIYQLREAKEQDIQFEMKYTQSNLTCELCIPLECTERYPWSFASASKLGVGIETPESDFSQMRGPRLNSAGMMDASNGGGGGRGGGRGGIGGGMGGDMSDAGSMPMGGRQQDPIKIWMNVILATK